MTDGRHLPGAWSVPAWHKLSAFALFGDYVVARGGRWMIAVGPEAGALNALIEARAATTASLDPDLARANLRAGIGVLRSGLGEFVYATPEQSLVLVRQAHLAGPGQATRLVAELASVYAGRLSMLCGTEVPATARIYEFPDLTVTRRALCRLAEEFEETTPLRSAVWLGAQLRGRGQPFHPSMVATLEEQTSLLQSNGIDMNELPSWWWRGLAARASHGGEVEIFDEFPAGEGLGDLVLTPESTPGVLGG